MAEVWFAGQIQFLQPNKNKKLLTSHQDLFKYMQEQKQQQQNSFFSFYYSKSDVSDGHL